tara:strand:+ start:1451 stop:1732 length:282 start_codon:yes stop_codon:yes gene_type:complete
MLESAMEYFSEEYLAAAAKTPRLKSYSETLKENHLKRKAIRVDRYEAVKAMEGYAKHMHAYGRSDESIKKELMDALKYVLESEDYKEASNETN